MKQVYRLIRRLIAVLRRLRGFRSVQRFGIQVKLSPDTEFSDSIWFHYPKRSSKDRIVGYADYVQWHAMAALLEKLDRPPVILEIGAHHGAYASVLGAMLKQRGGGRLIAVEASPSNVVQLKQNIRLNGLEKVVEVEEVFVSDEDHEGFIGFIEWGSQSTLSNAPDAIKVRCESLASLIARLQLDRIDILLVDIEGAEVVVMPAFPWAKVPVGHIFCELHPSEWPRFGGNEKFENMLKEQDFICLDMYFGRYESVRDQHHVGPAVLIRRNAQAAHDH